MNLPVPLRPEDVDAGPVLAQLQVPLVIQHAVDDPSTPASASVAIDAALTEAGLPHELHLYEGPDHLFTGKDLELALGRDLQYFRQRMQVETPQLSNGVISRCTRYAGCYPVGSADDGSVNRSQGWANLSEIKIT